MNEILPTEIRTSPFNPIQNASVGCRPESWFPFVVSGEAEGGWLCHALSEETLPTPPGKTRPEKLPSFTAYNHEIPRLLLTSLPCIHHSPFPLPKKEK